MNRRAWRVVPYDKTKALALARESGVDEFAVLLLLSRGYDTAEKIRDFVFCEETPLASPFDIKDMDKAAARVRKAVDNGEKILVYGDYDCDGVTATALLCSYLEAVGADVHYYIPSRIIEGYGLSESGVKNIIAEGYSLVITVDNGISAVEEARLLKENGVSLVITDHHKAGAVLPDAEAVVDPHREDDKSVFKELAGVGVALKLCAALENGDTETVLGELGELAAIGTIADIVELSGENRTIVSLGLKQLANTSRPGLAALFEVANAGGREISSTTVAFTVAPRINAAGRMDDAAAALRLLMTDDPEEGAELAEELSRLNAQRQQTEADIAEAAERYFAEHPERLLDRVLVVPGEGFHPGVVGIAAARLMDKYSKPAIVITVPEQGVCRGSCRSVEGFSMFSALSACADLLVQFGGHTLAAGFSIERENIEKFRRKINDFALLTGAVYPVLSIDCRLNPANLSTEITDSLAVLEPFGAQNPVPVFGLFQMTVAAVKPVGGGKHLRVTLVRDTAAVNAMWFGVTEQSFPFMRGDTVDVAVKTELNEFRGKVSLAVHIKDMRPAGADDDAVFGGLDAADCVRRGEDISDDKKAMLCPDRAFIAKIYKYIREHEPVDISDEMLAVRTGFPPENAGKARLCIAALCAEGLIKQTPEGLATVKTDKKADLTQSALLRRVGYGDNK